MRGAVTWTSAAIMAFLATAGAFLLLANLGTGSSEKELPSRSGKQGSGPALELSVDDDGLASLQGLPDQDISFELRNEGDATLEDVGLTLGVFPEDTSVSDVRYYRASVQELPAGGKATARFEVDLSPHPGATAGPGSEAPREIVEARATTPEGISAVKTVILPLAEPGP